MLWLSRGGLSDRRQRYFVSESGHLMQIKHAKAPCNNVAYKWSKRSSSNSTSPTGVPKSAVAISMLLSLVENDYLALTEN